MLVDYPVKSPICAGLLFDVAGSYPAAVYSRIREHRKRRPKSVEDALRSDVTAIACDMRQAMKKWSAANE